MTDNAWIEEDELVDEFEFSQIKHGFHAWNIMSPELEFCNVAAAVVETLPDNAFIIETGMGQGYVTRRILEVLKPTQMFASWDTDQYWVNLAYETKSQEAFVHILPGSPIPEDIAIASLLILDSEMGTRMYEFDIWWRRAIPGSLVLIHDTYPYSIEDRTIMSFIKRRDIQGWHFTNPRGSFLGVHP